MLTLRKGRLLRAIHDRGCNPGHLNEYPYSRSISRNTAGQLQVTSGKVLMYYCTSTTACEDVVWTLLGPRQHQVLPSQRLRRIGARYRSQEHSVSMPSTPVRTDTREKTLRCWYRPAIGVNMDRRPSDVRGSQDFMQVEIERHAIRKH